MKAVLSTRATHSSRSSGEIAYHYSYLQSGRDMSKGVLSTRTTRTSLSSGGTVSHYRFGHTHTRIGSVLGLIHKSVCSGVTCLKNKA